MGARILLMHACFWLVVHTVVKNDVLLLWLLWLLLLVGHKLYVWYRPVVISNNSNLTSEPDVTERITVYVKPFLPAIIKENYTKSQQPKSASTPATATTATAASTQQPSSENSSKKNVQDGQYLFEL